MIRDEHDPSWITVAQTASCRAVSTSFQCIFTRPARKRNAVSNEDCPRAHGSAQPRASSPAWRQPRLSI